MADDQQLAQPMAWHRENWDQLCRRLASAQLPHALLLKGQAGIGKRQFALAFGQYLLCRKRAAGHSCGHCRDCQLNRAATHPDLLLIEPDEPGKQIKVAQVRQMIEFTEKTPQQGGYRVVVLCPAEGMNISSANALLKCLEEPGRETLILLVSQQVNALLPTIRSRCQQLLFSKPTEEQALRWLAQAIDDPNRALTLLQLAAGEPSTALRYDQEGLLDQREAMKTGLAQLTRGQKTPVELALKWQSYDAIVVLEWLILWLQEMIRYRAANDKQWLATRDMETMLRYIADRAGQRSLLQIHGWLVKQRSLVLSQVNLNKQLLLEGVLIRWLNLSR